MFSEGIAGSGLTDVNVRFRMYLFVTMGIFAFGSVMYWRAQLFISAEYVEFPVHKVTQVDDASNVKEETTKVLERK